MRELSGGMGFPPLLTDISKPDPIRTSLWLGHFGGDVTHEPLVVYGMSKQPPVFQIEQNNFSFDVMLGNAHEERSEKVLGGHISRGEERNGTPADGRIGTPYNVPAESEAQPIHEVQHRAPSHNFIRFGRSGHTE